MTELLIFDVEGYIAHFRKFYSTTSSLSYGFPPRTVLIGLIAGILGRDRDSYYNEFSPRRCRLAVSVQSCIRKLTVKQLYLNTDTLDERHLRGLYEKEPRTLQTIELLLPEPPDTTVRYRVFFNHREDGVMNEVERRLREKLLFYPPYLGSMWCLADISFVDRVETEIYVPQNFVELSTVIPVSKHVEFEARDGLRIYREDRVPVSFTPGRVIEAVDDYIYERSGKSIRAKLKSEVFRCPLKGRDVFGVFME